ncbi:hypothetical protein E2C01_092331 [Portunus trituberculatus]|uniref:Uncharacterized protein n=1 Tax=Portunus trituberculatus TaxID=210409 RepID=A0A5B7JRF7_PORTR|nr:hypothetical protein [Portunus trituberculatus]
MPGEPRHILLFILGAANAQTAVTSAHLSFVHLFAPLPTAPHPVHESSERGKWPRARKRELL